MKNYIETKYHWWWVQVRMKKLMKFQKKKKPQRRPSDRSHIVHRIEQLSWHSICVCFFPSPKSFSRSILFSLLYTSFVHSNSLKSCMHFIISAYVVYVHVHILTEMFVVIYCRWHSCCCQLLTIFRFFFSTVVPKTHIIFSICWLYTVCRVCFFSLFSDKQHFKWYLLLLLTNSSATVVLASVFRSFVYLYRSSSYYFVDLHTFGPFIVRSESFFSFLVIKEEKSKKKKTFRREY